MVAPGFTFTYSELKLTVAGVKKWINIYSFLSLGLYRENPFFSGHIDLTAVNSMIFTSIAIFLFFWLKTLIFSLKISLFKGII